jgi:hypothetical protein
MLWFLSIYRLFALHTPFRPLLSLAVFTFVADCLMKLVHYINGERSEEKATLTTYFKANFKDFSFLMYLFALLLEDILQGEKSYYFLPFDAGFLVMGYQRFE